MGPKKDDPVRELANSFAHWEDVYRNGCSDPFWPDGVNLNLIRNHIIYHKEEIKDKFPRDQYPDIYYRETPPEVPNDYMAQADEIRKAARNTLQTYKADPNYGYLLERVDLLSDSAIRGVKHYQMQIDSPPIWGLFICNGTVTQM